MISSILENKDCFMDLSPEDITDIFEVQPEFL